MAEIAISMDVLRKFHCIFIKALVKLVELPLNAGCLLPIATTGYHNQSILVKVTILWTSPPFR
jgi:hypothetical protein